GGETLKEITDQNQKALEKINTTLETKVTALIEKTELNSKNTREEITKNIKELTDSSILQLDKINNQTKDDNKLIREALVNAFKDFQDVFDANVKSFNDLQKEKFQELGEKQNKLVEGTEKKL